MADETVRSDGFIHEWIIGHRTGEYSDYDASPLDALQKYC